MSTKPVSASRAIQQALRRLATPQNMASAISRAPENPAADNAPLPSSRADVLAGLDPSSPQAQPVVLGAFVEDVLAGHFGAQHRTDPALIELSARTRDVLLSKLQKNGSTEKICRLIQRALASRK